MPPPSEIRPEREPRHEQVFFQGRDQPVDNRTVDVECLRDLGDGQALFLFRDDFKNAQPAREGLKAHAASLRARRRACPRVACRPFMISRLPWDALVRRVRPTSRQC